MMNQVTTKGIEGNLVQEAIFSASTELNQAVTAHWDDRSLEPGEINSLARVIDDGNCESNSSLANYRQKSGHINQPLHRRCLDSNSTIISDALNAVAAVDSLDNMSKSYVGLYGKIGGGTVALNQTGYKNPYNVSVAITRPANFNGANNNNIKKIEVLITNPNDNSDIITKLTTYSANIGEIDYYKKEY